MNKYGLEHFHVSLIEKTDIPEEREKYWIEFFNSFKYGYNATLGGDGKPYVDYNLVISTYKQLKNQKETAAQLNISVDTVRNILQNANEYIYSVKENYGINVSKTVYMFDLQNNFLQAFSSLHDAATYMVDNKLTNCKHSTIRTHISEVCHKRRKTAAGFVWKFDNID